MEQSHPSKTLKRVLIVAITPYFLEKGNVWFEENLGKILEARKTQPFFEDNTLLLEQGAELGQSQLLRKLDEMGYEKVFHVQEPGEFAHQGGQLEVFPINSFNASRIEFLGNTIESIEKLGIQAGDEQKSKEILAKRLKSQKLFSDLKGIRQGDYLVHLDHGVGRFAGMQELQVNQYYYTLEYDRNDKLFVPVGLERKLSRYIGFTDPHIARLGSPFWIKTKKKIKEEVEKLARELLDLYARREVANRTPYSKEKEILEIVKSTFPYQETPDQIETLEDIERDLAEQEPMDRIVCGDVGFGKTEIALRTMVRAAESGYQAALLAPTTILAYQHFQNFTKRLEKLPLRVAMLSRLQPQREQRYLIAKIKAGEVDIVIGTHRLLSQDVEFRNLQLLVIDDEQRFGVKQKEKLRELRTSLDILSLSATPIPRTLYMALSSLKRISMIQTPPEGRLQVSTVVTRRKEKIMKEAIEKELQRNGQVYYLHNRIGTVLPVVNMLKKLVPKARIGIAHGKLREKELIRVMDGFGNNKYNVLVATTIIENGLDLPNVNTLIVADAIRLGLAQAYQIRGRIGRSTRDAHAYFLYGSRLNEKANARLQALKEATELGSGYRIAMKDLEIRGAGNILGKEQSGSINSIGLNLYCQMLSEAVERLRK